MSDIISNYSDIGLDYDISYINTKIVSIEGYDDPIYLMTPDNTPAMVADMIMEAVDRSKAYLLDHNPDSLVEDVRVWFSHPETPSHDPDDLYNNKTFWAKIGVIIHTEQEQERRDADDWYEETRNMSRVRQNALADEMRNDNRY